MRNDPLTCPAPPALAMRSAMATSSSACGSISRPWAFSTAARPVEQRHAQVVLQATDLRADGGLSQAQLGPGAGEGTVPRHRDEGLELFDHYQYF